MKPRLSKSAIQLREQIDDACWLSRSECGTMIENHFDIDGNEFVVIDRGNGEFTSMPKAVWDELEAAKENGTIS
jgi:hypothetical protein